MTASGDPQAHEREAEARAWLAAGTQASLGTLSADPASEGWPFQSIVPYALDERGRPLLLLAGIAQHTRNLARDPRASLLVCQPDAPDPQAGWRLTLLGRMRRLRRTGRAARASDGSDAAAPVGDDASDEEMGEAAYEALVDRYRARVPSAGSYLEAGSHGFRLWRMSEVTRVRAIGGFGRIAWIDPAGLSA